MKRISTAAVAAATALSLATVPAMAQENTAAATTTTPAATTTPSQPSETTTPATETTTPATTQPSQPSETTTPATTQPSQPTTTTTKPQQNQQKSSGSSQGTLVGIFSGTLGAVLTTSLIVFSDPRGANKIIDMVNAQFGLGLPHLHTPKVELPNFQLPNLPF